MQAIIDFAMEVDPTTEIALTVLARPISLAGTEVLADNDNYRVTVVVANLSWVDLI